MEYKKIELMAKTIEQPLVTFTEKAIEKIKEFMKEENNLNLYLRIYIASGGCAGFSYGMAFEEAPTDDDVVFEVGGVKVIIDEFSAKYIKGSTVDYVETLMGSGFKIDNPNATYTCSCGSSFHV
jgi:iron-sulfur cluster assembly accessory protein